MGFKFKRLFRHGNIFKVAAVAAGAWYAGPATWSVLSKTAGTIAPSILAGRVAGPGGPSAEPSVIYNVPFNPGSSYTGSPETYGSAAYQTSLGGFSGGGAAVPISQGGSADSVVGGFRVTPVTIAVGLAVLGLGFFALRR